VLSLDWCTEFLAKNSFATIVLRILWNSSREFSAIVTRILRNSTFQNLDAVPYFAVTAFFLQLDIDSGFFFPWTARIEPTIVRYYEKLECNLISIPLAVRCWAEEEEEAEKYSMQEGFKKVWRNQVSVKI
jgi:hypothetical protein